MTKFAPHTAISFIACSKLTFDEKDGLLRVARASHHKRLCLFALTDVMSSRYFRSMDDVFVPQTENVNLD